MRSHDCVSWEDQWSVCKMEAQGSWWYSGVVSVQFLNWKGSQWCTSQSKSGGWGIRSTNVQEKMDDLLQEERMYPSSTFFFYLGPPLIGQWPLTLVEVIFFTRSTSSNVHLFWKHSHRHDQKTMFFQLCGHPLAQPRWYMKLTIIVSVDFLFHEQVVIFFPWILCPGILNYITRVCLN